MKRRKLIGLLAAAAGTAGVVGSGAFTSVRAERSVDVTVADDRDALLRLEPIVDEGLDGEPTGRSRSFGGEVSFSIPGNGRGENDNAEGIGTDSIYRFDDLLRIENQGTQTAEVFSRYDTGAGEFVDIALTNSEGNRLRDVRPTLGIGESIDVGLLIDSHDTPVREASYEETLTIVADASD